jgi:hypothetical protein
MFAIQEPTPRPPVVGELIQRMQELQKETEQAREEVYQLRQKEAREKAERAARTKRRLEQHEKEAKEAAAGVRRRTRRAQALKPKASDPELLAIPEPTPRTDTGAPVLIPVVPVPSLGDEERSRASLVAEKNALAAKIARANRRWHCRWLRIGCIGRK